MLLNYVKYVAYAPIYGVEVNIAQQNRIYSTSHFLVVY